MPHPFKIVQTPSMTIFLHESYVGNTFRQIFTDGRPLPKLAETEPAWLGYSVGRWEGDSFVVETIGFRDKGWLSANMAYPNSEALKTTERFRRVDFGHLEETVTIDLRGKSAFSDYMIVTTGRVNRHVGAIAENVTKALKETGIKGIHVEGLPNCDWVLIDSGDVIVHVFRPEVREFYNLERLWTQSPAAAKAI